MILIVKCIFFLTSNLWLGQPNENIISEHIKLLWMIFAKCEKKLWMIRKNIRKSWYLYISKKAKTCITFFSLRFKKLTSFESTLKRNHSIFTIMFEMLMRDCWILIILAFYKKKFNLSIFKVNLKIKVSLNKTLRNLLPNVFFILISRIQFH